MNKADLKAGHLIGKGVLTWKTGERVSDRYGSIWLMRDGGNSTNNTGAQKMDIPSSIIGATGTLVARVIETRESTHIGDFFRGIFPATPKVGQKFKLGTGKLFVEAGEPSASVGVAPPDGRASDWLDPKKLYKIHEQTVELFFVVAKEADAISTESQCLPMPADK